MIEEILEIINNAEAEVCSLKYVFKRVNTLLALNRKEHERHIVIRLL